MAELRAPQICNPAEDQTQGSVRAWEFKTLRLDLKECSLAAVAKESFMEGFMEEVFLETSPNSSVQRGRGKRECRSRVRESRDSHEVQQYAGLLCTWVC